MPIYAKSSKYGGPKEPLAEHTINDIKIGRQLVANLPLSDAEKSLIGSDLDLILAFHDIGKAASGFQKSLEKDAPYWGYRHEIVSGVAAQSTGMKDVVIFSVLTHHKTLPGNGVVSGSSCLDDYQLPYENHIYEVWNKMSSQWYENLDELNEEWRQICEFIHRDSTPNLNLNTPLSNNMVNWLDRDNQTKHFSFKQIEYVSLLRGLTITADHIASSGSNALIKVPSLYDYNLTPSKPYQYQIKAGKKVGNLLLQSPTGSGKTEAALLWAQRNQKRNGRLFYTLPTTASLNAMYLRLKKSFDDIDSRLIGLLHSRIANSIYSMLEEDDSSRQKMAWMLSSLAREMYFPIRVCTPHQVLKFTLFGKGWEMMLSEFPHSVFVFDEIHAYNPKHVGLTMATAKYIIEKGGSVMFLSATLPTFLREIIQHEIPDIGFIQPTVTDESDRRILEQKRHILEIKDGSILSNIDFIIKEADKTGADSTLVICNHVPTAQLVYKGLKEKVNDTVLLHSRFTRGDRNKIEKELQRSKLPHTDSNYKSLPKVLVSTQVVEVSLDLDFEQGFTEPAPIDAIVQRLGRINRYASRPPAKVTIFINQAHSYNIYDKDVTTKSLEILSALPKPLGEEDLRTAADHVYGEGYNHDNQIEYNEGLNCIQIKDMVAGTNRDWVDDLIKDNEGSLEVLPEPLIDEYYTNKKEGLVIEALGLCVPVGRWRLDALFKENRVDTSHDPWILRNCIYSPKLGLEIL